MLFFGDLTVRVFAGVLLFNACLLMTTTAALSAPSQTDAKTARQKINLSGRQRMLSQRMTAAACLTLAGIASDERATVAQNAYDDFAKALNGLQYGDSDLGLQVERNKHVLEAFRNVTEVWSIMGPAVQQLSAGDQHSIVVLQLMDGNLPLLKLSNDAVQQITAVYGGGVIDEHSAATIDIAGRQRMLSQKMMKEACFTAIGLSAEQNSKNLDATMAVFHKSLQQLLVGDDAAGIMKPPSRMVSAQLAKVSTQWETFRTGLSLIEPDLPASREALAQLAQQSDAVLKEMHQAVLLYVSDTQ